MIALIDSDILVYRVGFASQDVSEGLARARLDESIHQIQDALSTDKVRHFITSSDKSNFRLDLSPIYKANRKQPKPIHYWMLRDYLIEKHKAIVVEGQEADDAIGIAQCKWEEDETCIVTLDKDLEQIPGWHYNFVKLLKYKISELEAMRAFYTQVLVGDTSDNVKGCPKIGAVKAQRYLEGCRDENEMLGVVTELYANAYRNDDWVDYLLLSGNLLWIRRKENQPWTLSNGKVSSKEILKEFLNVPELTTNTKESQSNTSSPQVSTNTGQIGSLMEG